jgi:hypothetical protein
VINLSSLETELTQKIGAQTVQLATMGGVNGCHRLPNLHYVEDDDEFSIKESGFQCMEVRLDAHDQLLAALTVVNKPQTHLSNPTCGVKDEFVD